MQRLRYRLATLHQMTPDEVDELEPAEFGRRVAWLRKHDPDKRADRRAVLMAWAIWITKFPQSEVQISDFLPLLDEPEQEDETLRSEEECILACQSWAAWCGSAKGKK